MTLPGVAYKTKLHSVTSHPPLIVLGHRDLQGHLLLVPPLQRRGCKHHADREGYHAGHVAARAEKTTQRLATVDPRKCTQPDKITLATRTLWP
jgi:hypothetical protein